MNELKKIRYLIDTKEKLLKDIRKYDNQLVDKIMVKVAGHSKEWEASIFTLSFVLGCLRGLNLKSAHNFSKVEVK